MKSLLLLLVFSFSLLTCEAQSWLWGKEAVPDTTGLGDVSSDHTVVTDKKGNAYITGRIKGLTFGSYPAHNFTPTVAKYDLNGNITWLKQAIPTSTLSIGYGNSVALDGAGYIYVTGSFTDTMKFGALMLAAPSLSTFVVKYDNNGNEIWARQTVQTATSTSVGNAIVVDNTGNFCITGSFTDTVSFGAFTLRANGNQDVFTVKYDSSGKVLWAKQASPYSANAGGVGYSIALDVKGNEYITGFYSDTVMFGSDTLTGAGNMFLCKYDANGNVLWVKQPKLHGKCPSPVGTSVALDGRSNVWLAGDFYDTIYFGTDTLKAPVYDLVSFFLARYDTAGNFQLVKQAYGLDKNEWLGFSVCTDTLKTGGGILAFSGGGLPPCSVAFGKQVFTLATKYGHASGILKFDTLGNTVCGTLFTEGYEDDGDAVTIDKAGNYIYFEGDLFDTAVFNKDTLVYGNDDIFLARWQPCVVSEEAVNEVGTKSEEVRVYPNPSKGVYTFEVKSEKLKVNSLVEVYNMLGEKVLVSPAGGGGQGPGEGVIDISRDSVGIYLYRVISETGQLIGTGKLIKD